MNDYVGQAPLTSGGEWGEVWWDGECFSLYVLDDSGMATDKVQHSIEPNRLKYMVLLNDEIEDWAFDNDVFI